MDVRQTVIDAANAYGLDPDRLLRQATQESGLNPAAVSRAGARGVMQLMPATAKDLSVDINDPAANIMGGAHYMRQMLDRYGGDYNLALAAYNAGPGRVDAYLRGGKLPAETQAYVPAIMGAGQAPGAPPSGLARVVGGAPSAPAPQPAAAPGLLSGDVGDLARAYATAMAPINNPQSDGASLGSALARALAAQAQ